MVADAVGAGSSHVGFSGVYYEAGKEPAPGAPPKLHLLVESNEEFRVSTKIDRYSKCGVRDIYFLGGTSRPRDQAIAHRSLHGRTASGGPGSAANRPIQCVVSANVRLVGLRPISYSGCWLNSMF